MAASLTVAPVADAGSLHLRGVEHRYATAAGGDVHALARLDLDVEAGELLCLVGPSGCGKSTLLGIVAGLVRPTAGEVLLGDRRIVGPSRRRGVVFQSSASLYPWLTVRGNVELGPRLAGASRRARRERAEAELARVGLADFADHRVFELSGGMQQRCQIARALAADPDVLLLDEPFGALDALTRETLQAELLDIWRATGRTIVFVTHSIDEAVLLGSRVLVLSPRPGTVIVDERLPFSRSGRSTTDLRADPAVVETCHRLRATIAGGQDSAATPDTPLDPPTLSPDRVARLVPEPARRPSSSTELP